MTVEEKRAWIMAVVSLIGYAVYVVIILSRAGGTRLADVPYVATLLWTVGGAVVAAIVLEIVSMIGVPRGELLKDQRDKEIAQAGERIGSSFVVIGAMAAIVLAMFEADHFWIANTVYLAFTLSSVLGSLARIAAYRTGFQSW